MVRTNQHELDNQPGCSYIECFKGSDLRRTEIACVGWMIQVLSGSSFGNQGTYFFEQGMRQLSLPSFVRLPVGVEVLADYLDANPSAGLSTANSFKFNLGQYAIGFVGTCGSWFTMTVSLRPISTSTSFTDFSRNLVDERSICMGCPCSV